MLDLDTELGGRMQALEFINRLEHVWPNGPSSWKCRCPAHNDGSASMYIKESEGKILINCFAGCLAIDIVGSMGLHMRDLFTEERDYLTPYVIPKKVVKPSAWDRPLDSALWVLRGIDNRAYVRTGISTWASYCPICLSHLSPQRCLHIWEHEVGGEIGAYCTQGCCEKFILEYFQTHSKEKFSV